MATCADNSAPSPARRACDCKQQLAHYRRQARAAEHRWKVVWRAYTAAAEMTHEVALAESGAACGCAYDDSCEDCEPSRGLAWLTYRKALTDAKQRVFRSRNMWAKRHPKCRHCGWTPPMPAAPWAIRHHRVRTPLEVEFRLPGSGAVIGVAAARE